MPYSSSKIQPHGGPSLFLHHWTREQPIASIMIVHGYADHGFRFSHFAEYLNKAGFAVYAFDLRGHGRSEGVRAYIDRFSDYLSDLKRCIQCIDIERPMFLFGHSLGGLIASHYCTENEAGFDGLILSGAALKLDEGVSPILLKLAPLMSYLFPKVKTQKLDKTYLTRSRDVWESYHNDALVYLGGTRARTGHELIKAIQSIHQNLRKIDLPILTMHGGADLLTHPDGSIQLHAGVQSSDKTIRIFEGLYHELINEPEKEEVMQYIVDWIRQRT